MDLSNLLGLVYKGFACLLVGRAKLLFFVQRSLYQLNPLFDYIYAGDI